MTDNHALDKYVVFSVNISNCGSVLQSSENKLINLLLSPLRRGELFTGPGLFLLSAAPR